MAVIAHHLVWTNYGTWLPNDLRGSGSQMVYTPTLAELGEPHFGRQKVQPSRQAVREFYDDAASRLQFPTIRFDVNLRDEVAAAIAETARKHQYTCYACAIMPEHVHLVIRKHRDKGETMIEHFQDESRLRLSLLGAVAVGHPVWTKGGWDRYLESLAAIRSRIRYVESNPEKEGLPRQVWPFVVAYDGWPYHKRPR